MSLLLTVPAQQALVSAQTLVAQTGNTAGSVFSGAANTLISTQAYSLAPTALSAFTFLNPLITTSNTVSCLLVSSTGSMTGAPALDVSGQSAGKVWLTVSNNASTGTFGGVLNISALVF